MSHSLDDKKYITTNAIIYKICTEATEKMVRTRDMNKLDVSNTTIKMMTKNLGSDTKVNSRVTSHLAKLLEPFNKA